MPVSTPSSNLSFAAGGDLRHEESAELFVAALERFIDASARPTTRVSS